MPIQAISFDFDGTLVQPGWRTLRMLPAVLRRRGALLHIQSAIERLRLSPRRHPDIHRAIIVEAAKHSHLAPAVLQEALEDDLDRAFPRAIRDAPSPAPIDALIKRCDEIGIPRVIVSDHPAIEKLRLRGGPAGWAAVISCRALGALKPLPDGLWAAAAQLGVPISALLHVGDRWETDGNAAAAAGCLFAHLSQADRLRRMI
ncbi:MAG: HAD family hydrolase [Myxococcota bacterium]